MKEAAGLRVSVHEGREGGQTRVRASCAELIDGGASSAVMVMERGGSGNDDGDDNGNGNGQV